MTIIEKWRPEYVNKTGQMRFHRPSLWDVDVEIGIAIFIVPMVQAGDVGDVEKLRTRPNWLHKFTIVVVRQVFQPIVTVSGNGLGRR